MAPEGEPDGLLIVGIRPGRVEDLKDTPNVGASGAFIRRLVARWWRGPVAHDNAVRCYAGGRDAEDSEIAACRKYLAQTVRVDVRPRRVVAFGEAAFVALLGRHLPSMSVRRGYGWLTGSGWNGDKPVPVFLLPHPARLMTNRYLAAQFEQDVKHVLTCPDPVPPPWLGSKARARVVETAGDAGIAAVELRHAEWFAFDAETEGRMFEHGFSVFALAACAKGSDRPWVWPERALLKEPATLAPLRDVLVDPRVRKVGQHVKYDLQALRQSLGFWPRYVHGDTRLWRRLLDAEADADLYTMAELVGLGGYKDESELEVERVKRQGASMRDGGSRPMNYGGEDSERDAAIDALLRLGADPADHAFALIPRDVLLRRCANDALATARLAEAFEAELSSEPEIVGLWRKVVRPASEALARVEAWGVAMNRSALQLFGAHIEQKLVHVKRRLDSYGLVDPDSPKEVGDFLYGKLKLPAQKMTEKAGRPSTDAEALAALRGMHDVVEPLLEWRVLSKLKGTYADGLYKHISPDERIHPTLNLDGARSGRLSSSKPNLQNIPRASSADGKLARDCFVAPRGHVLIEADYSQQELRVAAALSGDAEMKRLFCSGADFHRGTAELIAPVLWKVEPSAITDEHRTTAKAFNFGLIYGMTDKTLAERLGCSAEEARKIRNAVLGKFSGYAEWSARQVRDARACGHVWTFWDGQRARRRPMHLLGSGDGHERSRAEHGCVNSPIQGTANEYCLASLVEAVNWIEADGPPVKLVLTVHDSLLFEVREDAVEETVYQVGRIMTSWPVPNDVPLAVDFKAGLSWGSLEKRKKN